jgi:hypothetical protein
MIDFVCDTCGAVKQEDESWMLGLAAEAVGSVSARREVNIQSNWTRQAALHPLAVHFCSIQCKDEYMARLFGTGPAEEVVVENTIPTEVVVEREVPAKVVTSARRVGRQKRGS